MLGIAIKKNKVNLADYQFKKDIANRLFLSSLSPHDVNILQELLYLPSKIDFAELIENVEESKSEVLSALDKFSKIGLVVQQRETLFVDKELRKYFEFHIAKFKGTNEPSFEFLQGLLNRVPISVLPVWYSIPRTSDNIFSSLVEKHLFTPKIYEQYLKELTFSDPILKLIIQDVFESPTLCQTASELRKRYNIAKEKFQEYVLLLEFHFVLVSSFLDWDEVLTPFYEWADYLRFVKHHAPKPVKADQVLCQNDIEFAYLKSLPQSKLSFQELALHHFRKTIDEWQSVWAETINSIDKSVFEVEKSLRTIPEGQWILFDDFLKSMTATVGSQSPVHLARVGKRWHYLRPKYTEKERAFIQKVVLELLYEVGITQIGTYKSQPVFKITSFGRIALGEH